MKRSLFTLLALLASLALIAACSGSSDGSSAPDQEEPSIQVVTDAPVTVTGERSVAEIVGDENTELAVISPDGSAIAWIIGPRGGSGIFDQLCIFRVATGDKSCHDKPEKFVSYPYRLAWSPDSTQIAFTEDPLRLVDESDIWLFDVAAGTFADRTDDNVEGPYKARELGAQAPLDYLPMWNESNGLLYFWRTLVLEDGTETTLTLYRLDPHGGEAEEVQDVTEYFTGQLLAFNTEQFSMDGVSAVSPDGTKVALAVRTVQNLFDTPRNGLWVLDLTGSQEPPRQLATIGQFQTTLPEWYNFPAAPEGLSWSGDSQGVVVLAQGSDQNLPLLTFFYADVKDGSLTPVVDFSQVPSEQALITEPGANGLPMRFYSPWTASMSPGNTNLLMYSQLTDVSGILTSPIPPDGSLPAFIFLSKLETTIPTSQSSTSSDGKVLMENIEFSVEE